MNRKSFFSKADKEEEYGEEKAMEDLEEEDEEFMEYAPRANTAASTFPAATSSFASSTSLKNTLVLAPPLQPVSPMDIASFTDLDLALRSHPEMAKEGASVLNARAIARLVDGIRNFQSIHLGLGSVSVQNKAWPMVKLPDEIFRDRSTSGPLFTAIISSYQSKKELGWRQFDFFAPKRYSENMALLLRIQQDLIQARQLQRPIVYLDASIPADKRDRYIQIVTMYGGQYISSLNHHGYNTEDGTTRPTHIVGWDEEEHDTWTSVQEEEELAAKDQIAKVYFRTVAIVDPVTKRHGGGIVQSHLADSKKKGGKTKEVLPTMEQPMALIHWWYWPSSYDEWVPANEVDDVSEAVPTRSELGPFVVSCRFLRDVERFNEWGCEADYAISNYEKKVVYFQKRAEEMARLEAQKAEEKASTEKKSSGLKIKFSLPGNVPSTKDVLEQQHVTSGVPSSLPRPLLVGYDLKGAKVRRMVYDESLHIATPASEMVHTVLGNLTKKHLVEQDLSSVSKKPKILPGIASLQRPSVDPQFSSKFVVMEMRLGGKGETVIQNRTFKAAAHEQLVPRIRGGGSDGDELMNEALGNDVLDSSIGGDTFQKSAEASAEENTGIDHEDNEAHASVKDAEATAEGSVANLVRNASVNITATNPNTTKDQLAATTVTNASITVSRNFKIIPLPKDSSTIASTSSKAPLSLEQEPTTDTPTWYHPKTVSNVEMALLPEWFNNSAVHRTPATYLQSREGILDLARENIHGKYITATTVRRCIPGDIGSLIRLHTFLVTFGFINGSAIGESQPTDLGFLHQYSVFKNENKVTTQDSKNTSLDVKERSKERRNVLATAVIEQVQKRRRVDDSNELKIDWIAVSKSLADGTAPSDCQREFFSLNFDANDDITVVTSDSSPMTPTNATPSLNEMRGVLIQGLIERTRPEVLDAVINAALKATDGNLKEASNAASVGLFASEALLSARDQESNMKVLLKELLDQRMLKLETRLSYLDDAEELLDTERVALELERRDLYTARCRQWFGDGK